MKLRAKYKIGYGVLSISDQCLYFMFGTFFMFYMTTVVKINPSVAGVIAATGAIWDAISAVVIGHISDNCNSKYGKRKPFILFTSFPMAVITVVLFTNNNNLQYEIKIVYYLLMTILFWTFFSMFFIPVLAWGAELTENYDERTILRGFAYAGNTLGMSVGTVMPTILLDFYAKKGYSDTKSWQFVALWVGIIVMISLWIGLILLWDKNENKQKYKVEKENRSMKMKEIFFSILEVLRMPSLRYLIMGSILYLAANTIFVADRIYYYIFNMELKSNEISWLMAIEPFAGLLFLPIIYFSSKLLDKRHQYIVGMITCGIMMIALRFFNINTFAEAGVMLISFGLGAICYWQLMPAMIYDVCQLDELKTGETRQGTIVSIQVFSESLSEAVGLIVLGVLLDISGFDVASKIQTRGALFQVSNGFTIIPGILMILSAMVILKYPISKKVFEEIREALDRKNSNQKYSIEKFKNY